MKKPIVLINFKAYENSFGKKAVEMAKVIEGVSKDYSVDVIISVPATEIYRIAQEVSIPVYAEHVDAVDLGARTGAITVEMIKEAGAKGSLLNHSERRIRFDEIDDAVKKLRREGLESVVCVDRYTMVAPVGMLGPDAVLIEPPELIGTGISVSRAKPEVITKGVEEIRKTPGVELIAGAGISTGEDVYTAIKLGASGIGVASAVMKAKDPRKVVEDFVKSALRAIEEKGR
ncbi:MAG: triose-phosphate isomerase [Candidatus Aramenus sulfurataquae]|jgi:triosephosphate isomerase|uniref:Triosephosphate isomerase n=3 Tax=Candidatus Aramenus sulfurataquae TaxID=1326980 RepID=A0AAE3FLB4_9CREN|nr:triose-phosphate isomerase [Candidatus Aramenus sulfurataquae]